MDAVAQLNSALSGRYVIGREIGRGGMATVYLARDLRHERPVALKVLSPELGAVLGVERFLGEIRVTANLQHPNLLPLFDSGECDGLLYYVMPYVEGESLRRRLDREKQLPIDEALRISTAVASALDYAHRHGVIHRDLKPENILMQDGQPVVADFGIALAVTAAGGARITHTGLSLGTPQYMSPEQATGDRAVDGRSDVYSLAAVTYEMLAGEPPHLGNTVQAIIAKVLTEAAPSVRLRRPAVSPAVSAAVHRALEKLPADRFASPHDFAEALNGRGALGDRASNLVAPQPLRIERARFMWPLITVVACAAAAFASAGWWHAARSSQSEPAIAFALTLGPGERPYTFVSGSTVAVSPDGRTVVYLGSAGNATRQLYMRRLRDPRARPIAGTEFAAQPFFSPDGAWLGFLVGTQLKKVPLDGGAAVPLANLSSQPHGISWGAGGEIVAAVDGKLVGVAESGGAPRLIGGKELDGNASRRWPRWLDKETILYTVWRGTLSTARIAALSTKSGVSTDLAVIGSFPAGVIDGHLVYVESAGSVMAVQFDKRRLRAAGSPVPVIDQVMAWGNREGAANVSLADNGSLVYVRGSTIVQPVLADAAGTKPLMTAQRIYSYPRYSPDGKYVAINVDASTSNDIWILDVASGGLVKLTTEGTLNERAEWTADSKRVIFRSNRAGRVEVWSQPIDGSGPAERLFADPNADIWEAQLSSDGRTVVYRTGTTGSADVWYRDLRGDSIRKPLAVTSFSEWEPRLSPDGRWIAYSSNETGAFQVYVRAFPSTGPRTQVSLDGGGAPLWSRDGRRLFYVHGSEILSAVLDTAAERKVLSRMKVLDGEFYFPVGHPNYDVSPDGRLLLLKSGSEETQILVIHNWKSELHARAAMGTASQRPR